MLSTPESEAEIITLKDGTIVYITGKLATEFKKDPDSVKDFLEKRFLERGKI